MLKNCARFILLLVSAAIILSPIFMTGSSAGAAAATYTDSTCSSSSSSFASGSTVYGGVTSPTGPSPYTVQYINPSGSSVQTDSLALVSGKLYCDSTGCSTNCASPASSGWSINILDNNGHLDTTASFTITAAVPVFPIGILPLVLLLPILYFVLRRLTLSRINAGRFFPESAHFSRPDCFFRRSSMVEILEPIKTKRLEWYLRQQPPRIFH